MEFEVYVDKDDEEDSKEKGKKSMKKKEIEKKLSECEYCKELSLPGRAGDGSTGS